MPKPEGWKGSDMRSRSEVVQWLHDHGGDVRDKTGLLVGRMAREMGRGRALSQMLQDMEHDGMIEREVRGRRTFRIALKDDWGLLEGQKQFTPEPQAQHGDGDGVPRRDIDLTALAEALLAVALKRAQMPPSQGAELERLRDENARCKADIRALRDQLAAVRESEAEARRQAEAMRENLSRYGSPPRHPERNTYPLDEANLRVLDQLMRETPGTRT